VKPAASIRKTAPISETGIATIGMMTALQWGHTILGYPFVQLIHFLGLSLWVGSIAFLDFCLLGMGKRAGSLSAVAGRLFPCTWGGLVIVAIGGTMLFSAAAASYLDNPAFRVKFLLLLTGIVYHFVIQRNIPLWDQSSDRSGQGRPETPPIAKLAGLAELL
jgi:hypothetical protein